MLAHAKAVLVGQVGRVQMHYSRVVRITPPFQQTFRHQTFQHACKIAGRQSAGIGRGTGGYSGVSPDEPHHADFNRGAGPRLQIERCREPPRYRVDQINQFVKLRRLSFSHDTRHLL
ncbi:hypothetical protein ATO6_13490 [Oceanicola sp. 22II-s10i]|nr:hypothetical protein ATO6_13490 [Oceanicola sp. 22II-s10i]